MRGFSPGIRVEAVDAEGAQLAARPPAPDALPAPCRCVEFAGRREFGHRWCSFSRSAPWAGSTRPRRSACSGAPGGSRSARRPRPSTQHSVCFSQFSSSRCGKSSRACAPRLSVRFAAEWIVAIACSSRFSSSSVSIRSVFQIERAIRDAHVGEGGEGLRRASRMPCVQRLARCGTPRHRAAWSSASPGGSAAVGREPLRMAQPVEARDGAARRHPSAAALWRAPGLTISRAVARRLAAEDDEVEQRVASRDGWRRAPRRRPPRRPPSVPAPRSPDRRRAACTTSPC